MNVSSVSAVQPVRNCQPINFKAVNPETTLQPAVEEKNNTTKYMIGATALAGIIGLGILGYKGHLGKGIQEFLGGIDKATLEAAQKVGLKPKQYKNLIGEFNVITKHDGKFDRPQMLNKLKELYENGVLKPDDEVHLISKSELKNDIFKELKVENIPENSSILHIAGKDRKTKHCELILHDGLVGAYAEGKGIRKINFVV